MIALLFSVLMKQVFYFIYLYKLNKAKIMILRLFKNKLNTFIKKQILKFVDLSFTKIIRNVNDCLKRIKKIRKRRINKKDFFYLID
jgi:hypothetical protein